MPICTRCHARVDDGTGICARCNAPVVSVLDGGRGAGGRRSTPTAPGSTPAHAGGKEADEDRLVLLLEEPLPEVAAMIREFLENSGIACVVHAESIGLLYRLPLTGASFSGARVFVRASDYPEARELVTHFFKQS